MTEVLILLAGVGAGLCGSIAGLASVVSYPALLAVGLPPFAANVTNTTAMMGTAVGAAAGSRPELRGRGRQVTIIAAQCALGGALGAAVLLALPEESFELIVPFLIAFGAVLLLARDRLRSLIDRRARRRPARPGGRSLRWSSATVLTGMYGGYFGAGAGIILLSVLGLRGRDTLAVTNAMKNIGTGAANFVAILVFIVWAPVAWWWVLWMGIGAVCGAWLGPGIVRILPERPLRWGIAMAGFVLAASLL